MKRILLLLLLASTTILSNAEHHDFFPGAIRHKDNGILKFDQSLYNNDIATDNSTVTYKVMREDLGAFVIISNATNKLYGTPERHGNGSLVEVLPEGVSESYYFVVKGLNEEIIEKYLGDRSLAGSFLYFDYILDTQGNIKEVVFEFMYDYPQSLVPPSVYFQLEKELKQRVKFIIPNDKKDRNFIEIFGEYRF